MVVGAADEQQYLAVDPAAAADHPHQPERPVAAMQNNALIEGHMDSAPQDIFSDAKLFIPELILTSSYDLESILSSGLIINVAVQQREVLAAAEKVRDEARNERDVEKKTQYHAQIDIYQEEADDSIGLPLGQIHYVLDGIDDLCMAYHGYKARAEDWCVVSSPVSLSRILVRPLTVPQRVLAGAGLGADGCE